MRGLLKSFLKKIFGPAHIAVYERIIFLIKKFNGGYFSLNQLDRKLEKYVDYDNGYFVELGANDGVTQSNSLYFELKRHWKGILVEPSPYNFQKCLSLRSKRNSIFCNACVGFDYKEKYVDIKYANLMSMSNNLDLDLEDKNIHIRNAKKFLKNEEIVFSFGAEARTLNDLLVEANAPKCIDFLSLDVEGAELEVLKGIDFKKFYFKYLLIEVRDLKRISEFLDKHNYVLEKKFSYHDYLFKNLTFH